MARPGVDGFVRTYVTPVLEAAGYVRDRRIYRLPADGICAVVEVFPQRTFDEGVLGFEVQCGLALPTTRLERSGEMPLARHGITSSTQQMSQVMPSPAADLLCLSELPYEAKWGLVIGDRERDVAVADELTGKLRESALPMLAAGLAGKRDPATFKRPGLRLMQWREPFTPKTLLHEFVAADGTVRPRGPGGPQLWV